MRDMKVIIATLETRRWPAWPIAAFSMKFEDLYNESKRNKWLRYFSVFCRIALALGFIPSGIVKVMGERFTG
jgi:hypothetical protein